MPSIPRSGRRRASATRLLTVVLTVALFGLVAPGTATAAGVEGRFAQWVNTARADAGLPPLAVHGGLASYARDHSQHMADTGRLEHSGVDRRLSGWRAVGENVGAGQDAQEMHRSFMESSGHRANILDDRFTEVGIGVVDRDGTLWVTEVFRQPSGSGAAQATPPPAPEPPSAEEPAPPPAPDPEPEPEPSVDRLTVTLARIEAIDSHDPVSDLLEVDPPEGAEPPGG